MIKPIFIDFCNFVNRKNRYQIDFDRSTNRNEKYKKKGPSKKEIYFSRRNIRDFTSAMPPDVFPTFSRGFMFPDAILCPPDVYPTVGMKGKPDVFSTSVDFMFHDANRLFPDRRNSSQSFYLSDCWVLRCNPDQTYSQRPTEIRQFADITGGSVVRLLWNRCFHQCLYCCL